MDVFLIQIFPIRCHSRSRGSNKRENIFDFERNMARYTITMNIAGYAFYH